MSAPDGRRVYVVRYRGEERDPGMGILEWRCRAWNAADAENHFYADGSDEQGWEIVSIELDKAAPRLRRVKRLRM